MLYDKMQDRILALPFDTMTEVYANNNQKLLVYRPSTLSARFKDYDVNTNFQIFLQIGDDKPFRPNHLRLLLDLKLRSRELPETINDLLLTFDEIFYGADPLEAVKHVENINYTQFINPSI